VFFLLGIRFYGCLKCILCLVVLPCWCFGAFMYVMCQFTANKYDTIRYDSDGFSWTVSRPNSAVCQLHVIKRFNELNTLVIF